jgi:protein gp37
MNLSPIEWTHYTSNPLRYLDPEGNIVHACVHASEGCRLCYSEKLAPRWGRKGMAFTAENMKRLTPFLDEKELHSILKLKAASGKMCFLGDMTDIFGEWVPDELLDKLFAVMALRSDVTFQILTKRADRMREYMSMRRLAPNSIAIIEMFWTFEDKMKVTGWPLPNVWLGVSCENQEWADKRIPLLLQTPAAVRFVSYEPALGSIDFGHVRNQLSERSYETFDSLQRKDSLNMGQARPGLDWIIVGGESGPGARPFEIRWAREVVQQCKVAGVPVFVKQLGADPREAHAGGHCSNVDCTHPNCGWIRHKLKSRKGGDPAEWREDLRVREFPK